MILTMLTWKSTQLKWSRFTSWPLLHRWTPYRALREDLRMVSPLPRIQMSPGSETMGFEFKTKGMSNMALQQVVLENCQAAEPWSSIAVLKQYSWSLKQ
jgi:hypothetical protein